MMKKMVRSMIPDDIYQKLSDFWYEFLSCFFALFPIQRRKIFISSYFGRGYGDNEKYVYEELVRLGADCDVVWQVKHPETDAGDFPQGIRVVRYKSPRAVYEMETASVWLDNSRKMFGHKRKNQLYIQTWHGGPGVKRVEADVENELSARYVRMAKKDSRMCDLMVSNSRFMTNLYRNAFWYQGEILECGSPRCDILCGEHPEIRQKVRDAYRLSLSARIVLYAPTFRKNQSLDVYNIDKKRTLDALEKRFGGDWVMLTRLHPTISEKAAELSHVGERDVNATLYPDMQELLAASDCLITDYSSSAADFILTGRPCFLYASDIQDYGNDRGYYFKWTEFPFAIAQDNDTLEENILSFDGAQYRARVDGFAERTGLLRESAGGRAVAERICRHIKWKTESDLN